MPDSSNRPALLKRRRRFAILWCAAGGPERGVGLRNRENAVFDAKLLDRIVCPETRTPLHVADNALVARLNEAIAAGRLKNRVGRQLESPLDGGLVREDGAVLYPIVDDIPVLLVDEAIELEHTDN